MIGPNPEIEILLQTPVQDKELLQYQQEFLEFAQMEEEQLTQDSQQSVEKPMMDMVHEIYSTPEQEMDLEEEIPLKKRKVNSTGNSPERAMPGSGNNQYTIIADQQDDEPMELPMGLNNQLNSAGGDETKINVNDKQSAIKALQFYSSDSAKDSLQLDASQLPDEDLVFDFDSQFVRFNEELFNSAIAGFIWSETLITSNSSHKDKFVKLSMKNCQHLSPKENINVLLHEMIHCYLTDICKKPREHCGDFDRMMENINRKLNSEITHAHESPAKPDAPYIWRCEDRNSGHAHNQSVSCLSLSENFIVFGSEMSVSLFKSRPLKFIKTVAKTGGVVHCVVINSGGYIAIGSDVDFHNNTLISCGRNVKIWKKEHTAWKNIGTLDEGELARWHPNGEYFSVAKDKKDLPHTSKTPDEIPESELFGMEDEIFDDVLIDNQAVEDNGTQEMDLDDDGVDDFVVDDDGGGYAEEFRTERDVLRYQEREGKKALKALRREYKMDPAVADAPVYPTHDIQEPFQPNSCPAKQNRQYLVFDGVGTVCAIESGTQFTMDVEFHDTSIRPFHFTDYNNYSLSSIGPSGVVFASQSTTTLNSLVYYRPFDNWANKNDWTFSLPKDETAQVVACTMSRVVVASNQQYLRIFSTSGIQVGIRSLSGPVVSMCGGNDLLFCVYHLAGVYHGNQNLGYMLLDMNTSQVVAQDLLPVSPCSKLTWVGFSTLGYPCTFDSEGILRGLFMNSGNMWTPLFDSKIFKKERAEEYWPVGVADSDFLCVVLKGNTHPNFPKPIINDLPLNIPLLELENDTVKLEQQIIQSRLIYKETSIGEEAKIDKLTLQLLANACKNEQTQRALDLCDMLYLISSIDGAIKIAVFYQQPALGERMNHIKQKRANEEKEEAPVYTRPSRFESTLVDDDFESPSHKKTRIEAPKYQFFDQKDTEDDLQPSLPFAEPAEMEISKPFIPKSKPIPIPNAKPTVKVKSVAEEPKLKPINPFGLDKAKKPLNPFGRAPVAEKVDAEPKKRKQITLEGFVKKPEEPKIRKIEDEPNKIRKIDLAESSAAPKDSADMMEKFAKKSAEIEDREKCLEVEKMFDDEKENAGNENDGNENIVKEKLAEMTDRPKGKGVAPSHAGLAQFLYQK
ncbi:hypothetical protein HDV01_001434 [Terramyces sp. JEL0728]|nr:hypothetical protein HDV01_001434 [Terramyces sp. JEL0728]